MRRVFSDWFSVGRGLGALTVTGLFIAVAVPAAVLTANAQWGEFSIPGSIWSLAAFMLGTWVAFAASFVWLAPT